MGRGGENTVAETERPASLQSDPRFAPFFDDSFNPATFASNALAGAHATAQATAEELQEGIRLLNLRLRDEVNQRHAELLQQTGSLREAEGSMQGINLSVESLQSALRRAKAEVQEPYQEVRLKVSQLRNLHATVDLLRHIIHRLKLTQKLKAQLAAPAAQATSVLDLAKAAKLLSDIEAVGAEADLAGINVTDADTEFLHGAGQQVRTQAQAALKAGMDSLSQAEVGSALQVYFNLNELSEAVEGLIDQYTVQLDKAIAAALDPRKLAPGSSTGGGLLGGPGGARSTSSPGPGGSAKWQDTLWQKLAKVADQLHDAVVAVWHLQRVLSKKRDPLTHVLFIDVLLEPGTPLPCERVWEKVMQSLRDSMAAAANPAKGGFVREALVNSFPRLAALLEDLFMRMRRDTDVKGVAPAVAADQQEVLLSAAAPFQNAYLAAALARMQDGVTSAFSGGSRALPTAAELQKCIGRMHEELKAVGDSPRLAGQTASCVGKALRLLAEKAEYMAATGPDVRSISGACTSAQLRNINLCSHLQEVHRSLVTLLPRLPPQAAASLQSPLEAVQSMAIDAIMPIFRAVVEVAEDIILRMHAQDFGLAGSSNADAVTNASRYMVELTRHIAHCRVEYLSKFSPPPSPHVPSFVAALVERMASRLLVFFVRHASLLRPLSQAGKVQLAKDIAELEVSVGQNLFALEHLGTPFRVLRAFRPLLFLETSALPASPLLKELPPSTVLHHLYSRAPPALESPHTKNGFSPAQYSLWLDQHSMEDVLKYIKMALEGCSAKAKGEPGYADVYPLMLQLCTQQATSGQ